MKPIKRHVDSFKSLIWDKRGGVAIVFAFALMPMMALIGFVIDYARVSSFRAELATAADAAVTSAVAAKVAEADEKVVIERAMRGQLTSAQNAKLLSVDVTSARTELGRNITLKYKGENKNVISSLIGIEKLAFENTVTALAADPAFSDITFVLDKSSSMLLAASEADRVKMESLTGCAFACHKEDIYDPVRKKNISRTQFAADKGVRLRQDVMKDAVFGILTGLKAEQDKLTYNTHLPRYTTTITEFGNDWKLTQANSNDLSNPATTSKISTPDLIAAANAVKTIDGGAWEWTNATWPKLVKDDGSDRTEFNVIGVWDSLKGVSTLSSLQSSGDGLSPESRKKFMVFVTDGVVDVRNKSRRIHETFDPALCQPVKTRGVKVIVLYTRYLPLPSNGYYNANIAPWHSTIETKLKSCASPDMFVTADNEAEMNLAFKRIFTVLNGTRTRISK
jgi:Flp pilus assembly protein TadG